MKQKLLSGFLISFVFSASGHAQTLNNTEGLNIGTDNTVSTTSKGAAIGVYNSVAGQWSLVLGAGNSSSGSEILLGGEQSTIGSRTYGVIAFGINNDIDGLRNSAIFGDNNDVVTTSSTWENGLLISGNNNKVVRSSPQGGTGNILLGTNNKIDTTGLGQNYFTNASALIGLDNFTSKTESWVIGKGNIGQTGTLTLGTYASEVTDAALIVGRGTAANARLNGLVVLKDGTVQIPGNLEIGGEQALTATSVNTHLTSGGYLKRVMGSGSSASSSALVAWGASTAATGYGSVAIGDSATASADNAIAMGFEARATGFDSVSLGASSDASGNDSFAATWGWASGDRSIGLGFGRAYGHSSIAMGSHKVGNLTMANNATGVSSVSIGGIRNITYGLASYAFGTLIEANSAHSVAIGSLNKGEWTSKTDWVQTDPLFELGNGSTSSFAMYPIPSNLRSNAITTLKNGQTKLTNKFWSSTTPLAVPSNATESSNGEALVVEGHTVLKGNTKLAGDTKLSGKVTLEEAQGDISMGIYQ